MKQPEQVEVICCNPEFVDQWSIVLNFGNDRNDRLETLTCSNNPSSPLGVFSSNDGDLTEDGDNFVDWKDLPLSLQKFIYNYIAENK
jgi:hypothetical protein